MSKNNNTLKTLRVGAVQVQSSLGQTQSNLEHATPFIEEAARQEAQIICLPELAAPGYAMSPLLWDFGETRQGLTVAWTSETARRLGVYLGCGFLEADGEDFFNSYVVCRPDGKVACIVRKTMAETGIFKCACGPNVIPSELGVIGLGICADNMFAPLARQMQEASVDLMLMPHAVPAPFKVGGLVSQADIEGIRRRSGHKAEQYAHLLGVPSVYINAVGPRSAEKWLGLIGGAIKPESWRLLGLSAIADSDGSLKAQMDELSEGIIVAEVTLDPARKLSSLPKIYGRYGGGTFDAHTPIQEALLYTDATYGRLYYRLSAQRKRKALAVSGGRRERLEPGFV